MAKTAGTPTPISQAALRRLAQATRTTTRDVRISPKIHAEAHAALLAFLERNIRGAIKSTKSQVQGTSWSLGQGDFQGSWFCIECVVGNFCLC